MDTFSVLEGNQQAELTVLRNGWLNPVFTLTDGINTFGKLSYGWDWRRTGKLESARQNWLIHPQKLFRRIIFASDLLTGQQVRIAKTGLFSWINKAEFPDGQTLFFKRDGIFSRTHTWYSEQYGDILIIESSLNRFKQPFKIIPVSNMLKNSIDPVLITFLGVNSILVQRSHSAAH